MCAIAINAKSADRVNAIHAQARSAMYAKKQGHTCPSFAAVSKSFSKPPRAALLCSRYAHDSWPQQHLKLQAMS